MFYGAVCMRTQPSLPKLGREIDPLETVIALMFGSLCPSDAHTALPRRGRSATVSPAWGAAALPYSSVPS